jgi:hypothetical protein
MLSEAVRLMGVMGGGAAARASGGLTPPPRSSNPSLRPRLGESAEHRRPAESTSGAGAEPRRRLKLTPTASDEALKTVFEPAADKRASERGQERDAEGDGWTWTDLLASLGSEQVAGEDELEQILIEEIRALGVDPMALFPEPRLEEIATALETGDLGGAREIAHRQAPAAIRKLARRVLSDKLLRAQADSFIQHQTSRLEEAIRRGQTRVAIARGLASETGRAYLMFDAAVGDLN